MEALAIVLAPWLPAAILYAIIRRHLAPRPSLAELADPGPIDALATAVTQPAGVLDDAIPLATSVWPCDCVVMYLRSGDVLFVSCGDHRRHKDWRAWETQMTSKEGPA